MLSVWEGMTRFQGHQLFELLSPLNSLAPRPQKGLLSEYRRDLGVDWLDLNLPHHQLTPDWLYH